MDADEAPKEEKDPTIADKPPSAAPAADPPLSQKEKAAMLADEDPLLISQSLTYVTDDGEILHSFQSAPFSTGERRCAGGDQ